jgi:hypothetical protein
MTCPFMNIIVLRAKLRRKLFKKRPIPLSNAALIASKTRSQS